MTDLDWYDEARRDGAVITYVQHRALVSSLEQWRGTVGPLPQCPECGAPLLAFAKSIAVSPAWKFVCGHVFVFDPPVRVQSVVSLLSAHPQDPYELPVR